MKFIYTTDGVSANQSPKTIDQALGYKRKVSFPYRSVAALEGALKTLNILEIHALAIELGLKPSNDRGKLCKAVVDQYKRVHKTYGGLVDPPQKDSGSDDFDPASYGN